MVKNLPSLRIFDFDEWHSRFQERRSKHLKNLFKNYPIKRTGPYQPLSSDVWTHVHLEGGSVVIISSAIYNKAPAKWGLFGACSYIRSDKRCEDNAVVEFDDQVYNKPIKQLLLDTINADVSSTPLGNLILFPVSP